MSSKNTNVPNLNPVAATTVPGYRHHKVVPMLQVENGKELHLPMVILNGRENMEVEANSYQDTLQLFRGKAPGINEPSNWDQILEANRAYWTIFYSTRLPNDLRSKWFESKTQVEESYNWDEAGILMNNHLTVRLSQPHLKNLDVNDPNAFQNALDQIKKLGPDGDFFLNGFTTHSVNQLMKYLVAQLESLQKSNGSSGTPSDSTSTTDKIQKPQNKENKK